MDDITTTSAAKLAQAISDKKVSATEVVQAHIDRIKEVNPKLNAVVQLVEERALSEAREADEALAKGESVGPLHGVPITIKDSLDTEDIVSTGGTTGRSSFVPDRDATAVARLRAAGAILMGKTNTPELTLDGETDNLIYGRTNNPYDLARSPGGSSGGAAAIVSAAGSPLDIGSDTGGSIRGPAHDCGIAGIKPTSGRVPRTGHIVPYGMGAQDALTQLGPMARYVEDLTLALGIIAGPDMEDPAIVPAPLGDPALVDIKTLRIATHSNNGLVEPTPETTEAVSRAAAALSEAGASVVEDVPEALKRSTDLYDRLEGIDGRTWVRRMLKKAGTTEVGDLLTKMLAEAKMGSSEQFSKLLEELDEYRSLMLQFMANYDALLVPSISHPAVLHGESHNEEYSDYSHTSAYNLTGWPGAVVRGGTSPEGMPIGVQVVARPWREDVALALAQHLETALGGWQPPPL